MNADQSGIRPILSFVNTIRKNFKGILNSIKLGITNAVAEGINSKIQTAKSRAKGFGKIDNFKSMIYFLGNNFNFEIH
ncbi:Transposase [Arachidicoccus rhizosphaerae]|uniref:Transposase n=2 Tax=Arachidicoccus rhizosphaerae TaxID=551991 RepID=A0A1H4ABR6_9BACT|nr:Transposase [Arachidicoccus rhizosphaerae]